MYMGCFLRWRCTLETSRRSLGSMKVRRDVRNDRLARLGVAESGPFLGLAAGRTPIPCFPRPAAVVAGDPFPGGSASDLSVYKLALILAVYSLWCTTAGGSTSTPTETGARQPVERLASSACGFVGSVASGSCPDLAWAGPFLLFATLRRRGPGLRLGPQPNCRVPTRCLTLRICITWPGSTSSSTSGRRRR